MPVQVSPSVEADEDDMLGGDSDEDLSPSDLIAALGGGDALEQPEGFRMQQRGGGGGGGGGEGGPEASSGPRVEHAGGSATLRENGTALEPRQPEGTAAQPPMEDGDSDAETVVGNDQPNHAQPQPTAFMRLNQRSADPHQEGYGKGNGSGHGWAPSSPMVPGSLPPAREYRDAVRNHQSLIDDILGCSLT